MMEVCFCGCERPVAPELIPASGIGAVLYARGHQVDQLVQGYAESESRLNTRTLEAFRDESMLYGFYIADCIHRRTPTEPQVEEIARGWIDRSDLLGLGAPDPLVGVHEFVKNAALAQGLSEDQADSQFIRAAAVGEFDMFAALVPEPPTVRLTAFLAADISEALGVDFVLHENMGL